MLKRKREENQSGEKSLLKPDTSDNFISLEDPFPRGGGSGVAPLEIRQATTQAARDVYDEQKEPKKRKSKSKTKTITPETAVRSKKPQAEVFLLSKLKVGTLVLGEVAEVHSNYLVVSLPNNVIGFLQGIEDCSIYKAGEWLRCIVAGLGAAPSRKLQLVIDPLLVNQTIGPDDYIAGMSVQGLVTSVEDKGYLLDLGGKRRGFLPKKLASGELQENKITLCTVVKDKSGILALTQAETPPIATIHQQASLVPGILLTATVSNELKGGHMCSIFGHIDISVDSLHASDDMLEGAPEDARVLFSHPVDAVTDTNRTLALSMLKNTISLSTPSDSKAFSPGQILDVAKITSITPNGLFLDIGVDRPAFVHISNVADTHIEDLNTYAKYKVGTVHKARVLQYSYVDDCYYLTMKQSVLDQKFLKIDEIEVGEQVDGKIDRFLPKGGVLITLGDGIRALCPEQYLSDIPLQNPEKKFKSGQKVVGRVLSVDADENKVKITLKKSIVNSDAEILTDYPDVGFKTIGTIVALKEKGAIVEFFNDIKGYLPLKEMSETTITNPKTHFKLGQTISLYVIDSDESRSRLVVSCRAHNAVNADSGSKPELLQQVSAVVVEKIKDSFAVQINGYPAVLPFELLGDTIEASGKARKSISVGSSVNVLVLSTDKRVVVVTTKPMLIENNPPASMESLTLGDKIYGYVSNVDEESGVFVAFANNLTALMPKASLGETKYAKGQSVAVYVSAIDTKKDRFLVSASLSSAKNSKNQTYNVGDEVTAMVTAVKQTQLNVQVGDVQGRIEMTRLFDSLEEIEDPKHPLKQFSKGDKIQCKVIGYHDARNHKFLPITHRTGTHIVLELSARNKGLEDKYEVGTKVLAYINNYNDANDAVYVNINPTTRTRMSLVDLSNDSAKLADVEQNFPIGSVVSATVYSTSPLQVSAVGEEDSLAVVAKVMPTLLSIKLAHGQVGIVAAPDATADYEPLSKAFSAGAIVRATLVEQDDSNDKIWYSIIDPREISVNSGDVVKGYIKNVSDGGVFVMLTRSITGRVQISQLSDAYLKHWKKDFKVGQVVTAKVISKGANNRVELTLKQSLITGVSRAQSGLEDIEVGAIMDGTVRNVQDYGIFIGLDGTQLSGLCHKSQVSDKPVKDMSKLFTQGDAVKVKVLGVDSKNRKISLGLKASYFDEDSDAEMDEGSNEDEQQAEDVDDESAMEDEEVIPLPIESDSDSGVEQGSDALSDSDSDDNDDAVKAGVSAGFDWDADVLREQQDASDSDSSDDEDEKPKKKRKGEKFTQDKTATINSRAPQSAQDFERLLIASPDSSVMWMNYMAFQLQLSEIDAAREIANRALKTIPQREEQERQNIWIALLNLENSFGTEDTTQQVFKEACTFMDPLTMYQKMAGIYTASDKVEKANKTWNTACKKFGSEDLDVWVMYGKFLFDNSMVEEAHKLLDRAVQVLPTRLHKDLTIQFAKHEYNAGDFERGRTLMEGLVSAYPKKIDVWNFYVDQEIKLNASNRNGITRLFERILNLNLSTKQAKQVFKKWLSYEVESGDSQGVDYVKAKAQKFVDTN